MEDGWKIIVAHKHKVKKKKNICCAKFLFILCHKTCHCLKWVLLFTELKHTDMNAFAFKSNLQTVKSSYSFKSKSSLLSLFVWSQISVWSQQLQELHYRKMDLKHWAERFWVFFKANIDMLTFKLYFLSSSCIQHCCDDTVQQCIVLLYVHGGMWAVQSGNRVAGFACSVEPRSQSISVPSHP